MQVLAKQAPINIGKTRLREVIINPGQIYLGPEGQENEFEYICVIRLSKTSPNTVRRDQPKGKLTHVKICLGPEGQGKRVLFCIC